MIVLRSTKYLGYQAHTRTRTRTYSNKQTGMLTVIHTTGDIISFHHLFTRAAAADTALCKKH